MNVYHKSQFCLRYGTCDWLDMELTHIKLRMVLDRSLNLLTLLVVQLLWVHTQKRECNALLIGTVGLAHVV